MSEQESADKQYEPTPKKLEDARKKGDFPRSQDTTTAAAYAGLITAAVSVGAASLLGLGTILSRLVGRSAELSTSIFQNGTPEMGSVILLSALAVAPFFLFPGGFAVASIAVQRGFVFAPSKLSPKLSRISPMANAKNKFGMDGIFEFAKSSVKLAVYSVILGLFLAVKMPRILESVRTTPSMISLELMNLTVSFLFVVLVVAASLGAVDFVWQQNSHRRKNMMSRKEVSDEVKQQEGDPHLKQERRQRGYSIATNRMLADVPGADVVIVNPTHYAVALSWDRSRDAAPECVAKGVDEIAARIREAATEAGVPIHSDPPTARALHASVEIGQEIKPEHYRAVAAAIRFAESLRQKKRAR